MIELTPGHEYNLNVLDADPRLGKAVGWLIFVSRVGPKYPGNEISFPGTTTQEVLRALIARAKYVDGQSPHPINQPMIQEWRRQIWQLECRAAELHSRQLPELTTDFEFIPTCAICGHVGHSCSLTSPTITR